MRARRMKNYKERVKKREKATKQTDNDGTETKINENEQSNVCEWSLPKWETTSPKANIHYIYIYTKYE